MQVLSNRFWKYKLDHVLFWLALIIYFLINQKHLIGIGGWGYYFKDVAIKVGLLAFLTYVNLRLLIPYFFQKGKYIWYAILIMATIGLYVYIKNFKDLHYFGTLLGVPGYTYHSSTFPNFSNAVLFGCFGVALKLSKQFYFQQIQLHRVRIEKLETELKYLKAQINPHSVFNSINSVFSLIEKNNNPAREALAKFSDTLRYQLYECSKDKLDIGKEIHFLNNFIALQKLRRGPDIGIEYTIAEDVNNFEIAPLLIVPFVENAFKYVSRFETKENRIEISLDRQQNYFTLRVYNTLEKIIDPDSGSKGIGIGNVKRRLELLYPGKFVLDIHPMEDYFEVNLKLEIQ